MRIMLIDNYDSFTYNLVQELGKVQAKLFPGQPFDITVRRNDEYIDMTGYTHLLLSPGPGKPSEAGKLEQIIRDNIGKVQILGVCLGHQAICEIAGAKVTYAKEIMHGKSAKLKLTKEGIRSQLFEGIVDTDLVARYHSLVGLESSFPSDLHILAKSEDDEVMAVEYKGAYGVQFHPESILTPKGKSFLSNWLQLR